MRLGASWTLALVTGLVIGLVVIPPAASQPKVPPDFTFEQGKDSPGQVTFSHEKHRAKVDKCAACHTKVFKMKKGATGPLAMDKMKAGEQCGACHNAKTESAGKVVFTVDDKANCEKCHRKP